MYEEKLVRKNFHVFEFYLSSEISVIDDQLKQFLEAKLLPGWRYLGGEKVRVYGARMYVILENFKTLKGVAKALRLL
jgi:hypothetical protein